MISFENRVAVITGAGRGLGAGYARLLASRGAAVVVNDPGVASDGTATEATPAEEVAAQIKAAGGAAVAEHSSVSTPEGGAAIVQKALDEYGRIDILINNAAYNQLVPFKDLEGLTLDIWDHILLANLTSPFMCVKAVAPIMQRQKRGRIVNIASIAGLAPMGSSIAYAVSKAGLIHLTRCLAVALGPDVAVNAIAPGTMMGTRMTARLDPALVERTTKNAALQKPVERDDVARQAVEFCKSDSTTGQVLVLDSGVVYH
jgi:3-oxoacyl-[acyl-carrier protein] reductase